MRQTFRLVMCGGFLATALLGLGTFESIAAGGFSEFDQFLRTYVKNGNVDYEGFKKNTTTFQVTLDQLAVSLPDSLPSVSAKEAFWINAYNACIIQGVITHHPLKSIQEIPGFFDRVVYPVAGKPRTLNDIEKQARALQDRRVHFGLVCASRSCPLLRSEAYVAARVGDQLEDQARKFLADPQRGLRLDESNGVLWISMIFKWYASDFKSVSGRNSVIPALVPFLDPSVRRRVESRSWKIDYIPYDWSLNKQ